MSTVADYIGNGPVLEIFNGDAEADAVNENETPGQGVAQVESPVEPVAEVAEVAPATEIAKPPTATDDHYFDQLELLAKMAECSRNCNELQSQLAEVDEERKQLKAKIKSSELMMKEIAADIADLMANTYIPERKKFAVEPATKIESDAPGQAVATVDADWGDGKWREAKTAEVMEGVKGLGKKKLEALADLAPTIGELEDLRGTSGGVFKNVLPQGFGDKVASEIEDRLLEYARKQSNPPASEQVKQNKPAVVDDADTNISLAEVELMINRYRNDAEIERWDARDCDLDNEDVATTCTDEMEAGYLARKAGEPISAYPETFTHGELSDWAWGYVAREVMERIKEEADAPNQAVDEFSDL